MKKLILVLLLIFPFFVFAKEEVKYSKCVDGDTIKVIRKKEEITVRLLAVDTPEVNKKEYYAKEASDYTCNLIKKAKKIELEYDSKSSETDKYGRVLAWVYVDDELLNDELIKNGYAKVAYLYAHYKYVDILKVHEKKAQNSNIGIWNNEKVNSNNLSIWIVILLIMSAILWALYEFRIKKKLKRIIKKCKI